MTNHLSTIESQFINMQNESKNVRTNENNGHNVLSTITSFDKIDSNLY